MLRKIAELRHNGIYKLRDGKAAATVESYRWLSKKACSYEGPDKHLNTSMWAYMTLMFSIMCRSNTVSEIMLHHISVSNDAIIIRISKSKTDQEGQKDHDRHIYSNRNDPSTDVFLSLAVYIFSKPASVNGDPVSMRLFDCSADNDVDPITRLGGDNEDIDDANA